MRGPACLTIGESANCYNRNSNFQFLICELSVSVYLGSDRKYSHHSWRSCNIGDADDAIWGSSGLVISGAGLLTPHPVGPARRGTHAGSRQGHCTPACIHQHYQQSLQDTVPALIAGITPALVCLLCRYIIAHFSQLLIAISMKLLGKGLRRRNCSLAGNNPTRLSVKGLKQTNRGCCLLFLAFYWSSSGKPISFDDLSNGL